MATSGEIDNNWVEEIFAKFETVIFHKMQNNNEKMKCIVELKSKISASEEQRNKLQEYLKMLKDMIHNSRNHHTWISNINSAINASEMSILNTKKDIAVLESEKKVEIKPAERNKKLVLSMKKDLSEFHNKNFDLVLQKENRLLELKNQTKSFNVTQNLSKEKQELDDYIKEYDLLKAKNLHLKELISFSIKQQF